MGFNIQSHYGVDIEREYGGADVGIRSTLNYIMTTLPVGSRRSAGRPLGTQRWGATWRCCLSVNA